MRRTFEEDLERAVAYHGHLCGGQVIGTRMARLALAHFGIEAGEDYRDLVVMVEADRCLADAMVSVAGCGVGRRRLKLYDYGKMAATFYDIATGRAVRVCSINEARPEEGEDLVAFYQAIPDDRMFAVKAVEVDLGPFDLPGKPLRRVRCEACGETVMDGRDKEVAGRTLCKVCAGEPAYYREVEL
ncbi:MAG: FmdE family protein [Coriobacteriales bacterium]|jgi:formylmethanofuran dehydrogenase subunit E|nr:FmdE family protein [Coriobacteriales bacterium]